jgi:hypothetical protein
VFRATYRHCLGASAFRIVQIFVGERVAASVPAVHVGFEGGRFGLDADSCAAGEARVLRGPYGSLDCAGSRGIAQGNDLVVEWALAFDPSTFAGERRVFFDAKGGPGDPEPRLGWTEMGRFTVVSTPDAGPPDAGVASRSDAGAPASPDAGSPPGGDPRGDGGVAGPEDAPATAAHGGCALAGGAGTPAPILLLLLWLRGGQRRRWG